ncbi:MAG TPA: hypothetical protein DHU75_02910 [Rikenellaceae bacterium]|nr:hypothetical protein [Rikenellaceae bacterium]
MATIDDMNIYNSEYTGKQIDAGLGIIYYETEGVKSIPTSSVIATNAEGKSSPISINDLSIKLNLKNGVGAAAVQQIADAKYEGVIKAATKNPYAKVLDASLTDSETIGAAGDYATSLGGNSSAQGKRSISAGTFSVAKGAYSHSLGDNTVTTSKASDSMVHGYQTTTDGKASHAEGSYTVVLGQKYVEGMFDPTPSGDPSGEPSEPSETPTDSLEMDKRRGESAHAEGFNSYASGFAAHAEGISNVADGHVSRASGRSNRAWSYLSKVDGYQSVVKPDDGDANATGEGSWANGYGIQIIGAKYAYAGGEDGHVTKEAHNSFSHGKGLLTNGENQAVFGKYNENNSEVIFAVGTGADASNRRTSLEVLLNGNVKVPYPSLPESPVRTKDLQDASFAINKETVSYLALRANDIGADDGTIATNFNYLKNNKIGIDDIFQTTGSLTNRVMSQKAITDELNKKVTLSTEQTVTGLKVFTGGLNIRRSNLNIAPDGNLVFNTSNIKKIKFILPTTAPDEDVEITLPTTSRNMNDIGSGGSGSTTLQLSSTEYDATDTRWAESVDDIDKELGKYYIGIGLDKNNTVVSIRTTSNYGLSENSITTLEENKETWPEIKNDNRVIINKNDAGEITSKTMRIYSNAKIAGRTQIAFIRQS